MPSLNGLKLDLRTAPDFRVKSIKYFVKISWLLAIITFVLTCYTLPPVKIFLNEYLHLNMPAKRNRLFFEIDFGLVTATFLVSIIGVLINSGRNRRRHDHLNASLVVISIISGIGGIIWLTLI